LRSGITERQLAYALRSVWKRGRGERKLYTTSPLGEAGGGEGREEEGARRT